MDSQGPHIMSSDDFASIDNTFFNHLDFTGDLDNVSVNFSDWLNEDLVGTGDDNLASLDLAGAREQITTEGPALIIDQFESVDHTTGSSALRGPDSFMGYQQTLPHAAPAAPVTDLSGLISPTSVSTATLDDQTATQIRMPIADQIPTGTQMPTATPSALCECQCGHKHPPAHQPMNGSSHGTVQQPSPESGPQFFEVEHNGKIVYYRNFRHPGNFPNPDHTKMLNELLLGLSRVSRGFPVQTSSVATQQAAAEPTWDATAQQQPDLAAHDQAQMAAHHPAQQHAQVGMAVPRQTQQQAQVATHHHQWQAQEQAQAEVAAHHQAQLQAQMTAQHEEQQQWEAQMAAQHEAQQQAQMAAHRQAQQARVAARAHHHQGQSLRALIAARTQAPQAQVAAHRGQSLEPRAAVPVGAPHAQRAGDPSRRRGKRNATSEPGEEPESKARCHPRSCTQCKAVKAGCDSPAGIHGRCSRCVSLNLECVTGKDGRSKVDQEADIKQEAQLYRALAKQEVAVLILSRPDVQISDRLTDFVRQSIAEELPATRILDDIRARDLVPEAHLVEALTSVREPACFEELNRIWARKGTKVSELREDRARADMEAWALLAALRRAQQQQHVYPAGRQGHHDLVDQILYQPGYLARFRRDEDAFRPGSKFPKPSEWVSELLESRGDSLPPATLPAVRAASSQA